jgi:hypothetical protein
MSETFDNRKKNFENQFAHKEEQEFKTKIIAAKLFSNWAADEMHLNSEETNNYTRKIIDLSILDNDLAEIVNTVYRDLSARQINCSKSRLEMVLSQKFDEAKNNIKSSYTKTHF